MTKSRGIHRPRRPFTEAEDALLRDRYPNESGQAVADALGRPLHIVYARATKLGIAKSEAFFASDLSGRVQRGRQDPRMQKTQFKKGQVPANKGLRRPGWSVGRMTETQFKKGRPAQDARNYVPIGTEKVDRKRNVLVRKITDDPTLFPVARWRPVHVLVWEAHNGPIPEGHIVIFKQGKKTFVADEITIDRLELVTLAENLRRNSVHRFPKEVVQLIQLKGALVRRINRKEKERQA
jgi:hypothetical protein